MSDKKIGDTPQPPIKEDLPTVFVDNLMISTRSDGLNYLRFSTALPEGLKEEARMMIPMENLKRMIDILCQQCDHFPTKPKAKAENLKK